MSHPSVSVGATRLLVGKMAFPVALLVMLLILQLPLQGLSPHGQAMLGILALAIILWVTEAMAYPVSGLVIALMMTLFIGLTPNTDGVVMGTSKAIFFRDEGVFITQHYCDYRCADYGCRHAGNGV